MVREGLLSLVPPPVPEDVAARLFRERYALDEGLPVSVRVLEGEYDANFEIATANGCRYILKIMHPARERGLVELQCDALRHVARWNPTLVVPRVQTMKDGSRLAAVLVPGVSGGAESRLVWALSFIEGEPLALARPRAEALLAGTGGFLGELDAALVDFTHPAAERDFKWDLSRALWIEASLDHIADADRRGKVSRVAAMFRRDVVPRLATLRRSVIHGDANDYNVLVSRSAGEPPMARTVIDFGDMHLGLTVAEPAVAAAYGLLGMKDPLAAAAVLVAGYHAAHPLRDDEIDVLFPLILARLAVSVTNSAIRKAAKPDDPYVTISEAPAWEALERLLAIPPLVARATFRLACGRPGSDAAAEITAWIAANGARMAPVLDVDLRTTPCVVFDLSVGSPMLGADPAATATEALTDLLFGQMRDAGVDVGVGRYDEARLLYVSPLFGQGESPLAERRTVHLGVDLFVEPGSRVRAPLAGVVHIITNNDAPQDYGPLIILRHETDDGRGFFTLYGHLSEDTLAGLREGDAVSAGQVIARVGSPPGNGDWAPHLHFQIILDLLDLGRDFPGVCRASERAMWTALCPDPNLVLGIPSERFGPKPLSIEESLTRRRRLIGGNVRLSYASPLRIVRGFGAYLYDETGRAYLDMYNNVPLVGHSHPRVVQAIQRQTALLNTNTRYLHDCVLDYASRLTASLPESLRVCFFVNSGSEANDLALRMARVHTGRRDLIVLENAYHGHTAALIDASPYKFDGPGGAGRQDFVHVAPMPDDYRGRFRRDDPERGLKYARQVGDLARHLETPGGGPAAFIAETLPSVGGQIVPPPGYLAEAYAQVRAAGGLCIADEVQVGFGRLGTHFWGCQMQGAAPDIVVLGKPIANGYPMGAVITTEAIARSFDNGMEFFSTFGGNPVAAAAALAVLDVVKDEGLQARAKDIGGFLLAGLRALMDRHPVVGDARGVGLFIGVELVRDRGTLEPATRQAKYVVNRLRALGVLAGTDGPFENVIKLRPPLVLTREQAALFLEVLDDVLGEDDAQP